MRLNLNFSDNSQNLHYNGATNRYFYNVPDRHRVTLPDDHAVNYDERFSRHIIIIRENENNFDEVGSFYSDESRVQSAKTAGSDSDQLKRRPFFPAQA
jgi:hypothetical protein